MSNKPNGTLYVGVTSNLIQRVYQHKRSTFDGFTKKYCCYSLVYYELHSDMHSAITKEKLLKKYTRARKIKLILQNNPQWLDLYNTII
jgi:putative endonuclease